MTYVVDPINGTYIFVCIYLADEHGVRDPNDCKESGNVSNAVTLVIHTWVGHVNHTFF